MKLNVKEIVILCSVFACLLSLNFPLTRTRETCFIITQGQYQLEYVVSGNSESGVRCAIEQNQTMIMQIKGRSDFEGEFQIKQNEGTICFSSLDTQTKSVSADFIKIGDPLRGVIQNKRKLAIHQQLYRSYQQLEKLYRDQHFFLERNYIHEILLRNTQVSVLFFMILKLMIIFICAFLQLYIVKRILQTSFQSLPSEEPQGGSY